MFYLLSLTINKKEKTDTILNSKYKLEEQYKKFSKDTYDSSDWGYRKYKIYDQFTKKFDKITNVK